MRTTPQSLAVTFALGLLTLVGPAPVSGQASSRTPLTSLTVGGATSVISPVVVAQWFTSRKAGVEELALLVLWRGTPGWFLQPGGSGGSRASDSPAYTWIKYGEVSLSLDFDVARRIATIQGKTLALSDNNVLFVDSVDTPNGPQVAGMMAVPSAMPGSAGQIAPLLRQSPRIMSFLRCDAGNESPRKAVLQPLCLQSVGVAR
jgi:hypothetical protein